MHLKFDITDGLHANVREAASKAIENGSFESLGHIIDFYQQVIAESVKFRNLAYYKQYIDYPSNLYHEIQSAGSSIQTSTGFQRIVDKLPMQMNGIIRMVDTIQFEANPIADRSWKDVFYYEGFRSFNDLMYRASRRKDWGFIRTGVPFMVELANSRNIYLHQLQYHIKMHKQINVHGEYDKDIENLSQQVEEDGKFVEYARRSLLVFKYWLYFLHGEELISLEHLQPILDLFFQANIPAGTEENDLLFFRVHDLRQYMGWENWNIRDQDHSAEYVPLDTRMWITRGFLIDRLLSKNLYFLTDMVDDELRAGIPALQDASIRILGQMERIYSLRWAPLFGTEKDVLVRHGGELIHYIAVAAQNVIGKREQRIANAELSPAKIEEFRERVGMEWMAGAFIRHLFVAFSSTVDIKEDPTELKRFGLRHVFENGKESFMDNEGAVPPMESENFAVGVYHAENNYFVDVIRRSDIRKERGADHEGLLNDGISALKDRGVTPTIIVAGREFLRTYHPLSGRPKFDSSKRMHFQDAPQVQQYLVGFYDNIPVVASPTGSFNGGFLLADFSRTFRMKIRTNAGWFEHLLSVEVTALTEEEVMETFNDNPNKWLQAEIGGQINMNRVKVRIRNSVKIDVKTIGDFEVLDPECCYFGLLKS